MALLTCIALRLIGADWPMSTWLSWKLELFAGVMACGVGIRLALIEHFRTWTAMSREGAADHHNLVVQRTYVRATAVLVLLWAFIAGIVIVSLLKPA